MIDASIGLRNLPDKNAIETAGNALRFKLRGIFVLIGQLPQSAARADMAHAILRLRAFIFEAPGLMNEVAELQTHQFALATHKSERFRPVETISDLSNELTDTARGQIESAKAGLTLATNRSLFNLNAHDAVIDRGHWSDRPLCCGKADQQADGEFNESRPCHCGWIDIL